MKKRVDDPFGESSALSSSAVDNAPPSLPERGTGLKVGTADERKGGNPRTEAEREARHNRVVSVSIPPTKGESLPDGLESVFKDGVTHIWHKGRDLPDMSQMKEYKPESKTLASKTKSSSMEESWAKNKEAYYLKKK